MHLTHEQKIQVNIAARYTALSAQWMKRDYIIATRFAGDPLTTLRYIIEFYFHDNATVDLCNVTTFTENKISLDV